MKRGHWTFRNTYYTDDPDEICTHYYKDMESDPEFPRVIRAPGFGEPYESQEQQELCEQDIEQQTQLMILSDVTKALEREYEEALKTYRQYKQKKFQ